MMGFRQHMESLFTIYIFLNHSLVNVALLIGFICESIACCWIYSPLKIGQALILLINIICRIVNHKACILGSKILIGVNFLICLCCLLKIIKIINIFLILFLRCSSRIYIGWRYLYQITPFRASYRLLYFMLFFFILHPLSLNWLNGL